MKKTDTSQIHEDLVKISQIKQGYNSLITLIQSILGELELDVLLNKITDKFKNIYNTDGCLLLLYDKKKKEFCSKNIINSNDEIRISIEENLIREIFKSGKVLHIKDTKKEKQIYQAYDEKINFEAGSVLSVPLKNKSGIVFGILQLLHKKENYFSENDEELLLSIEPIVSTSIINTQYNMEYKKSLASFIDMISSTLDRRDYIMAGHSRRVTLYALEIGRKIKLNPKQMEIIKYAGLLHDIGKIGVPEIVLFKDRKLSEEEYEILKQHADLTETILKRVHFVSDFKTIPDIASAHHEKLDGSGYPAGLKGDQILLGSRILAVADVFDAITSRRQFRDRMPLEEVIKTLDDEAGTSFDPFIVYNFKLIELNRLIVILEYGYTDSINKNDLVKLKNYNLKDMIEIRQKTNKNESEIEIENIFMGYYLRRQKKT